MHTNTGRQTRQKLREPLQRVQWLYFFINPNIHNHPYQTALSPGQHSGLNKFNKLPNDHPQVSKGPDKTSALLISTDQPHNYCNIDEALQNSSSQNLTRKVKDWRDWTYTDGSLQKNEVGQDTGSGVYHPHLNNSHYAILKGMGIINTIALTCRSSSCSHTRLLTYSHRQPYITAPNQKAAVTPKSPSPPL